MINHLIKAAIIDASREGRYGYVAPFRTQAKTIAWDYLKHFSAPIPNRVVNVSAHSLSLPHRHRIRLFGADNPAALRGL
jgi:hypothetical protein